MIAIVALVIAIIWLGQQAWNQGDEPVDYGKDWLS